MKQMKRIAIYFFYDKDGIVDRYVGTVLQELKKNVERLIVVSNGQLTEKSEDFVHTYTSEIIMRENKGFDVWAYKTAMDSLGWEELLKYDEIILMNYTIMGPVYPLKEVFDTMDKRIELDFWGITKCFREDSQGAQDMWKNPYGYIPEHIQSSFTVFRRTIVSSLVFQQYWDNMSPILSYYESGGKHEQVITKYFADNGFKWDCYTQYRDAESEYYGCCPLITFPLEIVKCKKSPFFKRRSFFTTKRENTVALPKAFELLQFLKYETSYDVSMIYENMIRTCNQRDLVESFMLIHAKDASTKIPEKIIGVEKRLAIFAKIDTVVERDILVQQLKSLEHIADVFVNEGDNEFCNLNSLCTGSRRLGTGESADYRSYDYVLVINPFEQERNEAGTIYNVRQSYYIYNFIHNKNSLIQAVKFLDDNELEGMLTTLPDYMRTYHWEHYEQWSNVLHNIEKWKKKNCIDVLTDINKPPVRAEEGIFLVKCKAISGFEKLVWKNRSPEFIAYALPLIVQKNGYLPAYYTDTVRMSHNIFGYESYADWLPELRRIKEKYYAERTEYIELCERNLENQHKYIQECEKNLKQQNSYIQEKECQIKSIISSKWWRIGRFLKITQGK